MAGVVIDVDTKADGSKKELDTVNNKLLKILKSSQAAKAGVTATVYGDQKVNKKSFKEIKEGLGKIGGASSGVSRSMNADMAVVNGAIRSVKNAVVGLTATFLAFKGVDAFSKVSDEVLALRNRLSLTLDTQGAVIRKQRQLLDLSNRTRSPLKDSIGLFTEFSRALEASGSSETKILRMVELYQKAGKLSGSSRESLAASTTQFLQGLGSGTLRGEELNSVREQNRYLGRAIEDYVGLRGKALLDFAEAGKLTASVLEGVFDKMSDKTERDFKRVAASVEDGVAQMRQSFTLLFGDLNLYSGVSTLFANRLFIISDSIKDASWQIISASSLLRSSTSRFLRDIREMSPLEMATKNAASPQEVYRLLSHYSKIKGVVKAYDKWVDGRNSRKEGGFRDTLVEDLPKYKSLASELVQLTLLTSKNLSNIVPDIYFPVTSAFRKTVSAIQFQVFDFLKWSKTIWIPYKKDLEDVFQTFTGGTYSDRRQERAWARLFESRDLETAVFWLKEINNQKALIKHDDPSFILSRAGSNLRSGLLALENILIAFDLLPNKVVRIVSPGWDVMYKSLEIVGNTISEIYERSFEPSVTLFIRKFNLSLSNSMYALRDAITDNLSGWDALSHGERFGIRFSKGLETIYKTLNGSRAVWTFAESFKKVLTYILDIVKLFTSKILTFWYGVSREVARGLALDVFAKEAVYRLSLVKASFESLKDSIRTLPIRGVLALMRKLSDYTTNFIYGPRNTRGKSLLGDAFLDETLEFKLSFDWSDAKNKAIKHLDAFGDAVSEYGKRLKYKLDTPINIGDIGASLRTAGKTLSKYVSDAWSKRPERGHYLEPLFDNVLRYFSEMPKRVSEYSTHLGQAWKSVELFYNRVREAFSELYDKIVGNSYWPDTIDEVNSYTDRLGLSEGRISRFASNVVALYSKILSKVKSSGAGLRGAWSDFADVFTRIDWTTAAKSMASNIGVLLTSTIGLFSASSATKLISSQVLIGTLNQSLQGAVVEVIKLSSSFFGAMGRSFGENMVQGFTFSINAFVTSLPDIIGGALKGLLDIPELISDAFKFVASLSPINLVTNTGVHALIAAGLAFGVLVKDGFSKISGLLFGSSKGKTAFEKGGLIGELTGPLAGATSSLSKIHGGGKMALAIAATLSTVLLDSVRAIDVAVLVAPLLVYALLGPEFGRRFLRQMLLVTEIALITVRDVVASVVKRYFGEGFLYKALTLSFKAGGGVKSNLQSSIEGLFVPFKQAWKNLKKNTSAYASGKMGLADALLVERVFHRYSGGVQGPGIPVKTDFATPTKKFVDEFLKAMNFRTSASKLFTDLTEFLKKSKNRLSDVLLSDPKGGIGNFFSSMMDAFVSGFKKLSDKIRSMRIIDTFGTSGGVSGNGFVSGFAASQFSSAVGDNMKRSPMGDPRGTKKGIDLITDSLTNMGLALLNLKNYAVLNPKKALAGFGIIGVLSTVLGAMTGFKDSLRGVFDGLAGVIAVSSAMLLGVLGYVSADLRRRLISSEKSAADTAARIRYMRSVMDKDARREHVMSVKRMRDARKFAERSLISISEQDTEKAIASAKLRGASGADIALLRTSGDLDVKRIKRESVEHRAAMRREAMMAATQKGVPVPEYRKSLEWMLAPITGIPLVIQALFPGIRQKLSKVSSEMAGVYARAIDSVGVISSGARDLVGKVAKALNIAGLFDKVRFPFSKRATPNGKSDDGRLRIPFEGASGGSKGELAVQAAAAKGMLDTFRDAVFERRRKSEFMGPMPQTRFKKITSSALHIGGAFGGAFKSVMPPSILAILAKASAFLKIAIPVVAAGAIGLFLFGPGKTFRDKMSWAYDSVKSLFGMAPSGSIAREREISTSLKATQIGSQTFDLNAEIAKVDFGKLSKGQFNVVKAQSQEAQKTISELEASFVKYGKSSSEDLERLERTISEMTAVLNRMPQLAEQTFDGKFKANKERVFDSKFNNVGDAFLNAIGASPGNLLEIYGTNNSFGEKVALGASRSISYMFSVIISKFNLHAASAGAVVGGSMGAIFGGIPGAIAGAKLGAVVGTVGMLITRFTLDLVTTVSAAIWNSQRSIKIRGFASEVGDAFEWFINEVDYGIELLNARFKKFMTRRPSEQAAKEYSVLDNTTEELRKYYTSLPANEQKRFSEVFDKYVGASRMLDSLMADNEMNRGKAASDRLGFNKDVSEQTFLKNKYLEQLLSDAPSLGKEAKQLFESARLTSELKDLANEIKVVSGLDLGDTLEKFYGDQEDLDRLKQLNTRVMALNRQFNVATTLSERASAASAKKDAISDLDEFVKDVERRRNLAERIKSISDSSGVSEEILNALRNSDPVTFQKMDDRQGDIDALRQRKSSGIHLPEAMAGFAKDEAAYIKEQMTAVVDPTMEAINKGLQSAGASALTLDTYLTQDARTLGELARLSTDLAAQQKLLSSVSPFENGGVEYRKTLEGIWQLHERIKGQMQLTESQIFENLDPSNAVETYLRLSKNRGEKPDATLAASPGKLNKVLTVDKEINALEINQSSRELGLSQGGKIDATAYSRDAARLAALRKKKENLSQTPDIFTLDDAIGKLSNTGISVSRQMFGAFDEATRASLLNYAGLIDAEEKRLQNTAAGGSLQGVKRVDASLDGARKILQKNLTKSPEGLSILASSLGLDEASLGSLTEEGAGRLMSMFSRFVDLEAKTRRPTSMVDYFFNKEQLSKLVSEAKDWSETLKTTLESKLSKVSDVFGLSGGQPEVFMGLSDMLSTLVENASKSATRLREALSDGVAKDGTSAADVFAETLANKRRGELLQVAIDMAKSFQETITGKKRSEVASFLGLPDGASSRDAVKETDADLKRLSELADGVLTFDMADALSRFDGANASEILKELVTLSKLGGQTGATAPESFFKTLESTRLRRKQSVFSEELTNSPRLTVERYGSDLGFSVDATREASLEQLMSAAKLVDEIMSEMARVPYLDDETANKVKKNIASMRESLGELSTSIENSSKFLKKAGESFSNSVLSGLKDSFSKFLKGERIEMGEGDSLSRGHSLIKNVKSTLADNVVNTFMDGLEQGAGNSSLGRMLESVGIGISSLGMTAGAYGEKISKPLFVHVVNMAASTGKTPIDSVKDALSNAKKNVEKINEVAFGILEKNPDMADMVETVHEWFRNVDMTSLPGMLVDTINGLIFDVLDNSDKITELLKPLYEWFSSIDMSKFSDMIPNMLSGLGEWLSGMFSNGDILSGVSSALSGIGSWISGLFSGGSSGIMGIFSSLVGFKTGGKITGAGSGTSDDLLLRASNGEFIVNAAATAKNLPLLNAINEGNFSGFGVNMSSLPVAAVSGARGGDTYVSFSVTGDISRQTKRQIYEMLPEIATGIGKVNRERG